jgi:hypothetical protein|tara:strand:- start:88 stop:378 length:291 start_codon:yes stop_codon:yes gene_type:complete
MKQYQLKVVPLKGVTLAKRTRDEWLLGYGFKVISSTSLKYSRNDWITYNDIINDEDRYGVKFDIKFLVQTVEEYFRTMAEDDYGWDQASKTLGVNK